jgi:hypothetical protein
MGLCCAWAGLANGGVALEMDFANTSGAHLSFNGHGGITFTADTSGHDFQINNVSGGTGDSLNLFGTISGTFTIGAIGGGEAPITGSGVLTISDGLQNLTADINLSAIDKVNALGMLNPHETVNLSNVHYTGSNVDLRALAKDMDPTALFGFFDTHALSQLKSGQPVNTGFYGSLTASTPEPGTMTLFLLPVLGGLWFASRRQTAGASSEAV